jgi:hypothetical protein
MLKIRAAQMSSLLDARLGYVAETLRPYLRHHHANATAGFDDDQLAQRIRVGLRRARGWGFETMFGLGLFVALMFEVAPDFDTDPKIRDLLGDQSWPLDARLDAVGDALTDDEWGQVAARADPKAWEA